MTPPERDVGRDLSNAGSPPAAPTPPDSRDVDSSPGSPDADSTGDAPELPAVRRPSPDQSTTVASRPSEPRPHDTAQRRPTGARDLLRRRTVRRSLEWVFLVALALGVAVVLRTFVVQSFYIPSESMTPSLDVGDRVLVNKLSYRFGDPDRGDIVVFEAPEGETNGDVHDLIKRVVGLPGETIEGRDGDIYIDGERLDEPWLPNRARSRSFGPEVIPDDHYWMLGDNRFDSRDSTFFKGIERDAIVGEAFLRFWPLDDLSTL